MDIVTVSLIGLLILSAIAYHFEKRVMQSIIDRQQDTIQRLINREPVTYAETGQEPQKAPKQVYSAWGAQMVDINEDSRQ